MDRMQRVSWALAVLAIAALAASQGQIVRADETAQVQDPVPSAPLDRLKQSIAALAGGNPGLFDPGDLENFFKDQGSTSAARFLEQRGQNPRRASRLARNALAWRRKLNLSHLEASQFPCDLFKMGLIFEEGHAHRREPQSGEYVESSPVIWVRLGALGSIIKQLERASPARLLSYAYNTPRSAFQHIHQAVRSARQRHTQMTRADRKADRTKRRALKNLSAQSNESLQEVLRSIAWWLEDWARSHADTRATMVLDFEGTDFAFASWSIGEFFVKLDDMFPAMFEQIIGFRYKAKLWSLHSPISMFNRIFKSRVSSSPETDAKLKFVSSEAQMSAYMPRVDSRGFTTLPEYVSGLCVGPDENKTPAGCQSSGLGAPEKLKDSAFWKAINNEFYHSCKARAHNPNE